MPTEPRKRMSRRSILPAAALLATWAASGVAVAATAGVESLAAVAPPAAEPAEASPDYSSLLFVFVLATFIGMGVIARVSRLLHTPLMSITNAISAIAVVGSILVSGGDHPLPIRIMGAVALFASMTNIVSGFLITDRMLKMFKRPDAGAKR
jgi:NAD(P) transhydrogenase subunit alpha